MAFYISMVSKGYRQKKIIKGYFKKEITIFIKKKDDAQYLRLVLLVTGVLNDSHLCDAKPVMKMLQR